MDIEHEMTVYDTCHAIALLAGATPEEAKHTAADCIQVFEKHITAWEMQAVGAELPDMADVFADATIGKFARFAVAVHTKRHAADEDTSPESDA